MTYKKNITICIEHDLLDMFQKKVGYGNVSPTIEGLMRKFVKFNAKEQTQEEFLIDCEEEEALHELSLDPYEKIKFEYEKTKNADLTAVKYLARLKK